VSIYSCNDLNIYYEIHGQGEPLIFIHGLGSAGRDWEFQIPFFAKNYQLIVVDVRGHGQSQKTSEKYSIELFANDIAKLIAHLKLTKVSLIGLSMGGMIAFELAVKHPDLIKSMVIVNSGPGFLNMNFRLRFKFFLRLMSLRLLSLEKVGAAVAAGLFPKPKQQHLRELFLERYIQNDKKSYIKSLQALSKWNVVDSLSKISCPTLVLAADNDYTSIASKQKYVDKMPNAELVVIEDSHHALPVEKPEAFNTAVAKFFETIYP
jgi:pimeloyl-ACP methyl ester carboxylesterase